jgi:hypothetical protein
MRPCEKKRKQEESAAEKAVEAEEIHPRKIDEEE